ncbi:MAG: hypothetical protein ACI8XB_001174 [Patiriisocius sp.]|jgi:hypothetical protein
MRNKLIVIFLLILTGQVEAQISNTSLYSRFALGEIHDGTTIKQRGMSGLSIGVENPFMVNLNNPAALSFMKEPSFTVGLKYENVLASNSENEQRNTFSQFDHFAISFPVRKGSGGISLGLIPYSNMAYQYKDSLFIEDIDSYSNLTYNGEGGINTVFLKGGYKFKLNQDTTEFSQIDYLSFGAGFKYYFGSLTNTKRVEFPRGEGYINSFIADRSTYNDIGLDYGVFYKTFLKKKRDVKDKSLSLNVGATIKPSVKLNGKQSADVFSYLLNSLGEEFTVDSISAERDQSGYAILPTNIGAGISLDYFFQNKDGGFQRNLLFGLDFTTNSWSDFETNFFEVKDFTEVTDNTNLTFGLQYRPNTQFDDGQVSSYFQACTYRFGMRSSTLNLTLDNQRLTENGINLGVSLPLVYGLNSKNSETSLDLSVGYGTRGTTENALIKEDYLRIMVGFSLHPNQRFDKWFRKRKYD